MRYGKRVLLLSAAARAAPLPFDDPPTNRSFSSEEVEDGLHFYQSSSERPVQIDAFGETSALGEGNLLLLAPHDGGIPDVHSGGLIITPAGEPVWSSSAYGKVHDVMVQPFGPSNAPHLTFWAGARDTTAYSQGKGHGVVLDQSYSEVARIYLPQSVDATDVDLHEFRITSWDGRQTAMLSTVQTKKDPIGDRWAPYLLDTCVYEVDLGSQEVVWNWCPSEHVDQDGSYQVKIVRGWTSWAPFDFFHLNSVTKDPAGNYLISARCMHALYLVAPDGEIIWTLGGHALWGHGDFAVEEGSGDVSFGWQHHASWVPELVLPEEEGRVRYISLFDNGNSGFLLLATRQTSRGIILRIDEDEMTMSLVGSYEAPPELEGDPSSSQGSIQYLPSTGDVFVDFGKRPWYALYDLDGTTKLAGRLALDAETYRAVVYPWEGRPAYPPSIGVNVHPDPSVDGTVTDVFVSWNGATHASFYRLLGGPSPSSLAPLLDAPKAGFETVLRVPALSSSTPAWSEEPPPAAPEWLAVAALDATGAELSRSAVHRATLNSTLPRLPAGFGGKGVLGAFGPPRSSAGLTPTLGSLFLLVQRWVVKGLGL